MWVELRVGVDGGYVSCGRLGTFGILEDENAPHILARLLVVLQTQTISLLRTEQLKQRQLAKSPSGAFYRLRRGLEVAAFLVSSIYNLLDLRGGALVLDVELLAALDGPALDACRRMAPGIKVNPKNWPMRWHLPGN
jgi:hypothetical protein